MILAIDFDRTVVEEGPYDATTPLRFIEGAKQGLLSLKAAGHLLVLWSARASRALLYNPRLDPLVRAGAKRVNERQWELQRGLHLARYRQMLDFVDRELPGVFDAIDDGASGKFDADFFIDDKAIHFGQGLSGMGWANIARAYGVP